MIVSHKKIRLYVDKSNMQWIVKDEDGTFWALASGNNPWEQRQAIQSPDQLKLEPVPGHYKHMLGIPS